MTGLIPAVVLIAGWIGRAHDRWRARAARRFSLRAEVDALHEALGMAQAEARLLRGRFARLNPHKRPDYLPHERLEILAHAQRYGHSVERTARTFLVSVQTILNWRQELGVDNPRLVQAAPAMNRLPDLVADIARRLKRDWPAWGTRRIASILGRLGVKASRSTVQRILRRPGKPRPVRSAYAVRGPLVAKGPGHVALLDFTRVPGLFRCVWVGAAVDAFSRKILALRAFAGPSGAAAVALMRDALRREGRIVWVLSDQGPEFTCGRLGRFLRRRGIRRRFGAPGRKQSTAIVERFFRALKAEYVDAFFAYRSLSRLDRDLARYAAWFNGHRVHEGLGGRTPDEIHFARRRRKPQRIPSARLVVSHLGGDRRLPVLRLRRAG